MRRMIVYGLTFAGLICLLLATAIDFLEKGPKI